MEELNRTGRNRERPHIPRPVEVRPVPPPGGGQTPTGTEPETLLSWFKASGKGAARSLPRMWKTLALQLAVIGLINLVFWWYVDPFFLPSPLSTMAWIIIFLTATYNNVIPKTIYWLIVLTLGKRIFFRARREGIRPVFAQMGGLRAQVRDALKRAGNASYPLLLLGGGLGLIIANNFASYSRFSGARNKMDKYFVVIVIALAVSYSLGEARNGFLFKFLMLGSRDLARLFKKTSSLREEHVYLLLTGFVAGLLGNGLLVILSLKYGGYILGAISLAGSLILWLTRKPRKELSPS